MLQWSAQISHLAKDYTVVAYDVFGCGRSPKPTGWECYSTSELCEDLMALVRHCGLPGARNVLVCHSAGCSWGLMCAAQLADATPDSPMLAGLVLLSVLDAKPAVASHPVFRLPASFLNLLQPLLSAGFEERALAPVTRAGATPEHVELLSLCKATNSSNPMHMAKAYYRQMEVPASVVLASVRVPVLLLVGSHDLLAPPECSRRVAAVLPDCDLVELDGVAHQLMQEDPVAVNSRLSAFLVKCLG